MPQEQGYTLVVVDRAQGHKSRVIRAGPQEQDHKSDVIRAGP